MSKRKTGRDIESDAELYEVLERAHRLAVIGMKREGPASYVPAYMENRGFEIIPVNPKFRSVDGHPCVARVDQLEGGADMVVIFRRSEFVDGHVDEILAMNPLPQTVWMQLGIRDEAATARLRDDGIDVVQSRCLKIEYPRVVQR